MADAPHPSIAAMRADMFDGTPDAARRACELYQRIVGRDEIVRLTVALRLELTEGGQDWAIEIADADRLPALLDAYETRAFDAPEREALLELIVACLDEHLAYRAEDAGLSARVRRHLGDAFPAMRAIVEYWACLGEPERERFAVTALMREVWRDGVARAPG